MSYMPKTRRLHPYDAPKIVIDYRGVDVKDELTSLRTEDITLHKAVIDAVHRSTGIDFGPLSCESVCIGRDGMYLTWSGDDLVLYGTVNLSGTQRQRWEARWTFTQIGDLNGNSSQDQSV